MDILGQREKKDFKHSIYNITVTDFNGKEVLLVDRQAKAIIIVNVSTRDPDALISFKKLFTVHGCFGHRGLFFE